MSQLFDYIINSTKLQITSSFIISRFWSQDSSLKFENIYSTQFNRQIFNMCLKLAEHSMINRMKSNASSSKKAE